MGTQDCLGHNDRKSIVPVHSRQKVEMLFGLQSVESIDTEAVHTKGQLCFEETPVSVSEYISSAASIDVEVVLLADK